MFASSASNLVLNDTNGVGDVFIASVDSGSVECLTCDRPDGAQMALGISCSGRNVLFVSGGQTILRNRTAGTEEIIGPGELDDAALSGDGLTVAYLSQGEVWIHRSRSASDVRVTDTGGACSGNVALSRTGRFLPYATAIPNGAGFTIHHAYVLDLALGSTEEVDNGYGLDGLLPRVSANGRFVVSAPQHTAGCGLCLLDRTLGTVDCLAATADGAPSITPSGRFIAASSDGTVFIVDHEQGALARIGTGLAWSISDDGSRVGFWDGLNAMVWVK